MKKTTPEDDFAASVMSMGAVEEFEPNVTYIPEGDCLECAFSDEDYRAERVDSRITIHRGRESREIVGAVIKGFSRMLARVVKHCPGWTAITHNKTAKLEYVLLAHVLGQSSASALPRRKVYQQLLSKAEISAIQVPFRKVEDLAAAR